MHLPCQRACNAARTLRCRGGVRDCADVAPRRDSDHSEPAAARVRKTVSSVAPDASVLAVPRRPARAFPARAVARHAMAALACVVLGGLAWRATFMVQLEAQRQAAVHRLAFFAQSLESLLDRNEALPGLLALEGKLGALLD